MDIKKNNLPPHLITICPECWWQHDSITHVCEKCGHKRLLVVNPLDDEPELPRGNEVIAYLKREKNELVRTFPIDHFRFVELDLRIAAAEIERGEALKSKANLMSASHGLAKIKKRFVHVKSALRKLVAAVFEMGEPDVDDRGYNYTAIDRDIVDDVFVPLGVEKANLWHKIGRSLVGFPGHEPMASMDDVIDHVVEELVKGEMTGEDPSSAIKGDENEAQE